jgi:hypothetical protein
MTTKKNALFSRNLNLARLRWGQEFSDLVLEQLKHLSNDYRFSVASGDLLLLGANWYVTCTGLLRLAARRRCSGIHVQPIHEFSDIKDRVYTFKATVYKSNNSRGFVGYGDAAPSTVSALVRGAELRVAETRAVNRALRKAYGIGICSVEEIGSYIGQAASTGNSRKAPQPANGNGDNGGRSLRDRLCQLIRQHQLDANLVKSYASDFCGVKTLREATREQVENFVAYLADWAQKDCDALICRLNSYHAKREEGAA